MMPRAVSRANLFVKLRKHRIDFDKVHRFNAVNSIVIVIAKQTSTCQTHREYKPDKLYIRFLYFSIFRLDGDSGILGK